MSTLRSRLRQSCFLFAVFFADHPGPSIVLSIGAYALITGAFLGWDISRPIP